MEATELLRIGELSRRAGVSPELLRAWERRYALLQPIRSTGGLRLYSSDDVERVRLMQQHLGRGLAAAEAAALAAGAAQHHALTAAVDLPAFRADLAAAVDALDEPRVQSLLDAMLAATSIDAALADVIVPYLHELGERWQRGETSVAQEHFATTILRGRMLALARGWGRGLGPTALLACAPGEQHDLALLAFGLALRERGWRILFLGANSPIDGIADIADAANAAFVVVSSVDPGLFRAISRELRQLSRRHSVCLAGVGATVDESALGELMHLNGAPVAEAERLTKLMSEAASAVARSTTQGRRKVSASRR